ncbi:MAG: FliI/YscN family ATPase [Chloroflexota bacterium]|nr:FliI/YscN family ATPase [Chloroflexota bacterium]
MAIPDVAEQPTTQPSVLSTQSSLDVAKYRRILDNLLPLRSTGRVAKVIGLAIEVEGLNASVGELVYIYPGKSRDRMAAEVVGFKDDRIMVMPYGELAGIEAGCEVVGSGRLFDVPVGAGLLGRVIDGLGRPIDGKGRISASGRSMLLGGPPHPLKRTRISQVFSTGVRAIDGLLACGRGQRMGIFSGSGVGKSTLLGMIARYSSCDVSVIALIGERGREVQEFIERDLGPDGLARSVVVVSTSDQPALVRIKGAWVATAIAEHFRDQGRDVTLLMDSVTRFAMAQRELGLAIGEPPAMRGYPPSVFALLPKLMERAGTSDRGAISAFYTVLVEADDMNEPITDTARSVLDGHIVLGRDLAAENHYPAIDVLASVSRVMDSIVTPDQRVMAGMLRETLASYRDARDLINIGAYVAGSNAQIDRGIRLMPGINAFLKQRPEDRSSFDDTVQGLRAVVA